jgi:hypothetical protein
MLMDYRSDKLMDLGFTLGYKVDITDNKDFALNMLSVIYSAYSHDNHIFIDADLKKKVYLIKYDYPTWRI